MRRSRIPISPDSFSTCPHLTSVSKEHIRIEEAGFLGHQNSNPGGERERAAAASAVQSKRESQLT